MEQEAEVRAAVMETDSVEDWIGRGGGRERHAEAHPDQRDAGGVHLRLGGEEAGRTADDSRDAIGGAADLGQLPKRRSDAQHLRNDLRVLDSQHHSMDRPRHHRCRLPAGLTPGQQDDRRELLSVPPLGHGLAEDRRNGIPGIVAEAETEHLLDRVLFDQLAMEQAERNGFGQLRSAAAEEQQQ